MRLRPRMVVNVFRQIQEDWDVNNRDWRLPGFRALAVHRFGAWLRIAANRNPIWLLPTWLHRAMFRYVRNHYAIEVDPHATLGRRIYLRHAAGIVIHGCAVIGDGCIIRQNVTIGALNAEGGRGWEAPQLGRDVHVGCGAAILGRVTIGDDARIGPNTVVTTDVPAGATVFVNTPRMMLNMRRTARHDAEDRSSIAVGS